MLEAPARKEGGNHAENRGNGRPLKKLQQFMQVELKDNAEIQH